MPDHSDDASTRFTKVNKISIVTACKNAERYIEETITSVLDQTAVKSGRVALEYLVLDGLSTDKTAEIAETVGGSQVTLISAPDTGLYDALSRGLRACCGDVVAYLNAGDYYHKCAFDVVIDVMTKTNSLWLTGLDVWYNDKSQVTGTQLPYRYRPRSIQRGLHGTILPFIQQESTFWSRHLHQYVDFDRFAHLRLAGDAYLWNSFSKHTPLTIVCAYLGGFRVHPGQLSSSMASYRNELAQFSDDPSLIDKALGYIDRAIWHMPNGAKKKLNPSQILTFDHGSNDWR